MEDEAYLVTCMQKGDRTAFDQIYEQYQNRILRMAYLIVGNLADSEDITQETFVKCYLHCHELKEPAHFKAWLYQILTRTAWSYGKKKTKEYPDEEIERKAERSDGVNLLEHILESEQTKEIYQAVQRLDLKYRLVIVHYYYNQMSTKEIANAVGCLEGTVKSRLFTARKQLKNMLKSNEQEESYYEKTEQFGQRNHAGIISGR